MIYLDNIINPLLHFVQPAGRLLSSENLRFSDAENLRFLASAGPPEPPSEFEHQFAGGVRGTPEGSPNLQFWKWSKGLNVTIFCRRREYFLSKTGNLSLILIDLYVKVDRTIVPIIRWHWIKTCRSIYATDINLNMHTIWNAS